MKENVYNINDDVTKETEMQSFQYTLTEKIQTQGKCYCRVMNSDNTFSG